MLTGINHITIAVSDLDRSIEFYRHTLGMRLKVRWLKGAYLTLSGQWICLSVDKVCASKDYSHLALDVESEHFSDFSQTLLEQGVRQWKQNSSEGDSLYILDPDDYKLEIHSGNLASRLQVMREMQTDDMVFYDD